MKTAVIDSVTRGYLATNQRSRLLSASPVHLEATVCTTMSIEKRKFSWLWEQKNERALLVNRLTGTLFDPETGQGLQSTPRLLEAPIQVPDLQPSDERLDRLPIGVFSTAEC